MSAIPVVRSRLKPFIIVGLTLLVLWIGTTSAINTRRVQQRMKCAQQLKRIGDAFLAYHLQAPPGGDTLYWMASKGHVSSVDCTCPSTNHAVSYIILTGNTGPTENQVLITERGSNHVDGSNAFFANGECKFVRREQLQSLGIPE